MQSALLILRMTLTTVSAQPGAQMPAQSPAPVVKLLVLWRMPIAQKALIEAV